MIERLNAHRIEINKELIRIDILETLTRGSYTTETSTKYLD